MFWLNSWQLLLVLAADLLVGDPPHWPHLVRLVGGAIDRLVPRLRRRAATPAAQRLAGAALALAVAGGAGVAAWASLALARCVWEPLSDLLAMLLAFQCLAAGQLWREVRRVARILDCGDLTGARCALSMIVGRETGHLSPAEIRRALVETAAENLNDGVVAPLFYLALLGPVGAVVYKAVNTLDSMVGYKSEPWRHLGSFSARLDDVAGWLPARLTGLLLVAAAWLTRRDARSAWRVLLRDHAKHASPNAGWPEAACAGALGLRLGGPNHYHGRLVQKPWLNQPGRDPVPGDVSDALRLMLAASALAALLALGWSALVT